MLIKFQLLVRAGTDVPFQRVQATADFWRQAARQSATLLGQVHARQNKAELLSGGRTKHMRHLFFLSVFHFPNKTYFSPNPSLFIPITVLL